MHNEIDARPEANPVEGPNVKPTPALRFECATTLALSAVAGRVAAYQMAVTL